MPVHPIQAGDDLCRLAHQYGFSIAEIWDHADNATLKEKRGDPNVLLPGDELVIPDKVEKDESGASEARHDFKLPGVPWELRMKVLDRKHEGIADVDWKVEVDGEVAAQGKTASDGLITCKVMPGFGSAAIEVPGCRLDLKPGHLHPANVISGIQQRLLNLGYEVGPVDGCDSATFRAAVRAFQAAAKLDAITGEPDEETIKALRLLHEDREDTGDRNTLSDEVASTEDMSVTGDEDDWDDCEDVPDEDDGDDGTDEVD